MSVVIVGVIRRKPVLTHASIVCEGMLASVNSVKKFANLLSIRYSRVLCCCLQNFTKLNFEYLLHSDGVFDTKCTLSATFSGQNVVERCCFGML